jgi:hypothetical protein
VRLLAVLTAGLLAAGCAGEPPPPAPVTTSAPAPTGTTGVPLPVRVTRDEAPRPSVAQLDRWAGPAGDSPLEQVLQRLRYETLGQARLPAPTTARCARFSLRPGAENRCTVTYGGLAVPWTVTIDEDEADNGGPVDVFGYSVRADRFVVRAEAVRGAAWAFYGRSGSEVRCGRVPALRVLPAGPTGDTCQVLEERTWRPLRPRVSEDGDVVF